MAKLTLKLNGKVTQSLELEAGREYFIGRAPDCDFVLDDHRGISRQHLKVFESGGVWHCETLSKFLYPQLGEDNFETLEMNESVSFALNPYEFDFEVEASQALHASEENHHEESIDEKSQALVVAPHFNSHPFDDDEDTGAGFSSSEATAVGSLQLSSTLRVVYPSSSDNETLKLEGHVWTAGRESDCEIQLHNPKVSRKHFELHKNQDGYFVTDLGSSNGTLLNGQKIPPHEPTRIMSGDRLEVLDIELHFEIKASNLPAVTAQPLALTQAPWGQPQSMLPGPYEDDATRIGQIPTLEDESPKDLMGKIKSFDWKKNKLRVGLMAVVPILLVMILLEEEPKNQKDVASSSVDHNASFDNLSPEQKTAIKDSLGLARNLYVQGKYSLCLSELAKLHETVPFYDNSKELESFCIQGHELTQRKLDQERKERQKALVEQKITDITETCAEKYKNQGSVDEVRLCLAAAIELNPEHPNVIELIQRADDRAREKELLAERRKEAAQRRQEILSIFRRAQRYKSQGELVKARSTYQRFISRAGGDLSTEKAQARRELSSVSQNLNQKVGLLMDKCKALGASGKLKEAYQSCNAVLEEDKTVAEAIELKEKYSHSLRREMKVIYEDSKLEESLGNLEAAKEKWKKIREEDLESGDFYKKATIKLRQYGAI